MSLAATGVLTEVRGAKHHLVGVHPESAIVRSVGAGRLRTARAALLTFVFLLPVVVLPGLQYPFSRSKLLLWALVVLGGLAACGARVPIAWERLPLSFRIALAMWLGALGLSALLGQFASLESLILPLTGVGWFVLLLAVEAQAEDLSWSLVLSGSAVAALALAQFLHADPFAALGWVPAAGGGSRMRVFGTLGNPNFVAAFLASLLPLSFSLANTFPRRRGLLLGLSVLQAAAVLATGSRAPILALAAALLWMTALRARRVALGLGVAAVCIVALAAITSPARDLRTTLMGRSYIWKVSAPHVGEHFLLGLGPGGFAAAFPAWEAQYWQGTPEDGGRKFAGIEDHAHNDYLEILADYGALGLFGFTVVLAVLLRAAMKRTKTACDPLLTGASAGVVALAAVALVDFPLMRPAEVFLLWSLMAIGLLSSLPRSVDQKTDRRKS